MADSDLFECHDITEHASAIAKFLFGGELGIAAHQTGTLWNMFLRGLAHTNQEVESLLKLFDSELDIANTTAFLEGWERTVGIPDGCFDTNVDIETRRIQVLIKLASLGVQTEPDFVALAKLFGLDIVIVAGEEVGTFTFTFPFILFESAKAARFTMVVFYETPQANRFTLTFPYTFGDSSVPILECLFKRLAPANVNVIFRQIDELTPLLNRAFSPGFSDGFS